MAVLLTVVINARAPKSAGLYCRASQGVASNTAPWPPAVPNATMPARRASLLSISLPEAC